MLDDTPQDDLLTTPLATDRGLGAGLLWGVFLGVSWTWVIGMFFPILLVRDYGVIGWVAFAFPNVVGAAAMGFFLTPERSRRMLQKHMTMCRVFSEVTVAFQCYVLMWLMLRNGLSSETLEKTPFLMLAGVLALVLVVAPGVKSCTLSLCVVVWLVSVACFIFLWMQPSAWLNVTYAQEPGRLGLLGTAMFIPSSLFGFAFCPYLDLTFHRARQKTDNNTGRIAFATGFGFFFFSMIIFTLMYAGVGGVWLTGEVLPKLWFTTLLIHIALQVFVTVRLHNYEIARAAQGPTRFLSAGLAYLGAAALALYAVGPDAKGAFGLTFGEIAYRGFLMCYGTVFPAYIWLCVLPTLRPTKPTYRMPVFLVACLLVIPTTGMMFIAGEVLWAIPAAVVVILSRVVVELGPKAVED